VKLNVLFDKRSHKKVRVVKAFAIIDGELAQKNIEGNWTRLRTGSANNLLEHTLTSLSKSLRQQLFSFVEKLFVAIESL